MYNQDEQDNQDQDQAKRSINEFMQAVIDGDKEALFVVRAYAWEFMQAVMGETQELTAILRWAWEYTPTTEDEPAPRFPLSLTLWREAHPTAFVFDDEDEEWVNNTTPTEQDEVAPYSFPMPYPTEDDEDLDDLDGDLDGVLDGVWRYAPTLENPELFIAIAPSHRALRAAIRDGRWVNNPKVVRVSYRR